MSGFDVDIMVSESSDAGRSWSQPRAVNSNYNSDGSDDVSVALTSVPGM